MLNTRSYCNTWFAPPPREHPANKWITDATWNVVDYCTMLRRKGMLLQAVARNLGRKIKACLKADRLKRAATTALNVKGCLAAGEYIEAWHHLKGWYCSAEDRAPKPCPETLAKQTDKRIKLYTAVPPPGWAMQLNVDPSDVPAAAPTDSELRAVVGNLQNGRAAGATGMKAEHLKEWLADMKRKEAEDGVEGIGDCWRSFVTLLQAVWESGTVPTQMTWMIIVLLPKGGGDYRGIGLLDPIWKVVAKVMVAQFSVIKLHDCLHGGLPRRGTGTAIMEVKLQQQLAWVNQEPLYQIYLDLRKAYDALDWGRCLKILAGYGVGPSLLCLQKKFWDDAKLVCCVGGNYGLPFGAHRGVTQGGPLSSLMINVCVDCVVREWLWQVLGEVITQDGVGDLVRDQCIAFFVDNGLVAARCLEWLQTSFNILITLFKWIGLRMNAKKTKVMTCLPGKIRVAQTEEEYASQQTGLGTSMTKR
jgi:hypothetical protein